MTLLAATDLSKRFGGVTALAGFDLEIAAGDLLGLIGPNGAGKTTAFNLLTGLLAPSGGAIRFDGETITRAAPERRARLGMTRTFQNIRLFDDLTVRENVMAGAHARNGAGLIGCLFASSRHRRGEARIREIADGALARAGLAEAAHERAGALAYGDRRRVEIARALASEPRIILLDEPAAGMNDAEKADLAALIRRLNEEDGLAVVLVEHNVRMVAGLCRRLVVMNEGAVLAEGATDDILRLPEVEEVYLGRRRGETGRGRA